MCKMEEVVVLPRKSSFEKCYVSDIYIRRKKKINDKLFQNLNDCNEKN